MKRLARLMVLLPDELLSEIDQHRRYYPDLPPRAEAIRRLLRLGLDSIAEEAKRPDGLVEFAARGGK